MGVRIETPEIYKDLERKLMTATFTPGQRIKPADLQSEYGCSPNTIRDILLRLSKIGLVEFEVQRGFRAQVTTPERRRDIAEFRILLEQEGITRSLTRGGLAWQAEVSASHSRLSAIETGMVSSGLRSEALPLWSDAERSFHYTLISACESPVLIENYKNTYSQFRQQMVHDLSEFDALYFQEIVVEHKRILDAVHTGDPEACRTAVADHLSRHL